METKKIDYRFKILYTIGILMVVCGHAEGGGISLISEWFPYGGLHLAMFVFCSGYFYRSTEEEQVGRYILKKVKTLIVPMYIYTIIYGLFIAASRTQGFIIGNLFTLKNVLIMPLIDGHQFEYTMGGWFVVPLFMVQAYNILLRKIVRMLKWNVSEGVFFIINFALGLIGNSLAGNGYHEGLWLVLVRMLYFVPFYGMGIFYKSCLEKFDKKIPGIWYFTFIFAAKLIISCVYGKMLVYTPSWCDDFTEGPLMPIVIGCLGIAFWLRVATILEPVIGQNKYVNLIADSTYSIMMNQFFAFMIVKTIYAAISKITPYFHDFDWISYKASIWYCYKPQGLTCTLILYPVAAIVFSVFVQVMINKMKLTVQRLVCKQ